MKIPCPYCKAVFGIPPARRGQRVDCPRCRQLVSVPAVEEATPPRRRGFFFLVKTVVLLLLAVGLLRIGFTAGWKDAGRRLGDAPTRAEVPSKARPANRKAKRTAADVVEYFRDMGLRCTAVPGSGVFAPSKARDLLDVEGEGWHVALYQFDNDGDAERLARLEQTPEHPTIRNHNLVLRVIEGKDEVLSAFRHF
jgi:hypothetical protein